VSKLYRFCRKIYRFYILSIKNLVKSCVPCIFELLFIILLKSLLILLILLFTFTLSAQSNKLPCDTCLQTKLKKEQAVKIQKLKAVKDSSLAKEKQKVKIQKKELTQKATAKKEATKQLISSKTDSTARANKKTQLKTKGNTVIAAEKGKINGVKTKANALAKKPTSIFKSIPRKNIFSFTGEVRSENYFTTAQNPMMRNEPMYSRLYIAPTISLLGLPFKANFFFTTENNNTYKSNFFTFKFDVNAYRQKAAADMQKQIDEAKKMDRMRDFDLQKNALETQRYENELKGLKDQIPDADALQKTLNEQAEAKSKAYIEYQKQQAQEKLKNATEEEKLKIEQKLKQQQDSIINHYKQQAGDSLLQARGKVTGKVDTAQLGKYLRMQQQVENLKLNKQKIEDLRQLDSAKILQKASTMRNPDDLRKLAKQQMPGNKFMQEVLSIDRFGIGIVNPQYSEFTLFAASVKGVDIGVNKDKWFYDITLGKTTQQFTGAFTATKPIYNRNIGVLRAGIGQPKGNHLSAEYLYAFDPKTEDKTKAMTKNGVLNISANVKVIKTIQLEANVAQSSYKEIFVEQKINSTSSSSMPQISNNLFNPSAYRAYQLKTIYTLNENIKIEASVKQTGAAFRTVGNPFLRRNFREEELKYEQQFYKKKIKFSGFYKEMRDNILEINKATNRLKGYGLKISTYFEKYPNLSLSYSPYQQGNNHPDSAYRTNNQFSVINAVLTYKKRYKTINWNGLVSYTRSAMQINQLATVAYKLINSVHTFQIGNRNTSIVNFMQNITAPFVDSLNSSSIQFTHNYLAKKGLILGLIGEQTAYKNGASKTGCGIQISSSLFKNFNLTFVSRYDHINKLWNLQNANVFTEKLVAIWRW
jgi:hypothetical protein